MSLVLATSHILIDEILADLTTFCAFKFNWN